MIDGVEDASAMDLDDQQLQIQALSEHENDYTDPFIKFIDYAKSILSPTFNDEDDEREPTSDAEEREREGPGWSWIASRVLKTCISYSSGVTSAILLSELSQAWNEQKNTNAPRKRPDCINQLKKKHKRAKLPSTVTIDTIYEKNFLSLNSVLEAVVVDTFVLPGTNINMITLGDFWSSNTIDLYLHRRYYDLVSPDNGILKKGREVFLTGCYLRSANEGSGYPRLLPTEYLVVLLDEEQDDDAMLLGAQFCTDSFSSISLGGATDGVSYSLYARIESIGPLEMLEKFGGTQRKQIRLVDNESFGMNFLLWGDQVVLANLFSVGSMLAIDRPFIASALENGAETCDGVCLEYGSATQLYLVPFVTQGEQVCLALTSNRLRGSRFGTASCPTQGPKASQLTLPCDSQGSVDYSNYPFQSFIINLHEKMTGISIYGVVTDIFQDQNAAKSVFNLRIQDLTGTICVKLYFSDSWSLGRLSLGHTVYVSGLTCSLTKNKCLEARWFENDPRTSLVNLSCLPAVLNSSCLHKQSYLADMSKQNTDTHVCRVWLDQIEHCHVNTRLAHATCGHFIKTTASGCVECEFCCCSCEMKTTRAFHLKITVADESSKVFAWCTGQTASELLQISPDEFYELPEEEQVIYPCSLENERYMIAIVNCSQQETIFKERVTAENDMIPWEITRAFKL
ncbi:DNA replication licensing factor MCM3-like protein 3 [Bienertia sinuspersici]